MKSSRIVIYPAVADSVDLPDLTFYKNRNEDSFTLVTTDEQQALVEKNAITSDRAKSLDDLPLKTLLAPIWPKGFDSEITVHIVARRTALLKCRQDGMNLVVEAHWNLFIPYFYQIKELPVAHPEVLNIFALAVFNYAACALKHKKADKPRLRSLVVDVYRVHPEYLLASLDIFNKPGIYHIRPTKIWLNLISAINDEHHLEISDGITSSTSLVSPEFLEEVSAFIHKVVKNYSFRYVDYLWTQQYMISFRPDVSMVSYEGNNIVINIHPIINQTNWKPALYLSLGYAVMRTILQSSGGDDQKANIFLAMMKTWNRYLSFDESIERQSVHKLFGLPRSSKKDQRHALLKCMTEENPEFIADFIRFKDYSTKETFEERLTILKESRYGHRTGAYYEQLWNTIRSLNNTLMRNNISYSKLIEVLRNDHVDHLQLADLLFTGRLDNRSVVDVADWLLLRTLLYDLINAPKVFSNDYIMLLKVLTKVNKSLIIYVWTLIINNDPRHELVNSYIAKIIVDIFVFDRVKIYEIVADPVECLEAEAVTGYLLNWASLSPEELRSISTDVLSSLPSNIVTRLSVQTTNDVDQLIKVMTIRASGLIGFSLHQAYRWGSTQDELTERIRSYFPELLRKAERAILPQKAILGGAILLLILAQIISDERDGFAKNITIKEEDRRTVLGLIKQCLDWDQRHFVMMVGGMAVGYTGNIDDWILQQFDSLLGRYGGGDRVILRSVVQFDVKNLIERTLLTAKAGEESSLLGKIQLLRFGVDPVVSDQANKFLAALAFRHGISAPEIILTRKDIRELVLNLSQRIKEQNH